MEENQQNVLLGLNKSYRLRSSSKIVKVGLLSRPWEKRKQLAQEHKELKQKIKELKDEDIKNVLNLIALNPNLCIGTGKTCFTSSQEKEEARKYVEGFKLPIGNDLL